MTVFCITLFRMCTICVSRLWRAEIPHFICSRSLFVRRTRPSYFGMSKQSCRKAGFYILLWSFHGEVVIPGRGGRGVDSSSSCFAFAAHVSASFAGDAHAILLSINPKQDGTQKENKRLWSELQRPSLTPRPSPFRQLCAPGKSNIEFLFSPCCRKHPHHHQITGGFFREKDKEKKHISTSIFLPKTHWTPF